MFENFMAFDNNCMVTAFSGDTIYLVIFNNNGYGDAIDFLADNKESCKLSDKESSYYEWIDGVYKPLFEEDDIPQELINCFNIHKDKKECNTMFENFMAFDDCPIEKTDFQGDAIYLVIFNDDGYKDVINWFDNDSETCKISSKESSYYVYDDNGFYKPLYEEDDIPEELIDCFNKHRGTENKNIPTVSEHTTSSTPELYTVKLHLSDGTIIKPNYQSDNMLDFASIIEQLLTDELFNGQVEKIVID